MWRTDTSSATDGVDAPPRTGIKVCHSGDVESTKLEEASMNEVTMIGVDLAKSVFQAHGATATGEPVFRKKLSRGQFLKFLSELARRRAAEHA